MEARVESLWESLRSSSSSQRYVHAAEVASDLYSLCIEQITDAELAYSISVLLHSETGLIKFLQEIAAIEEYVNCKEELLLLLNDFVRIVGKRILPYAVAIKDLCVSLFMKDKAAKIKNATFTLLIGVLELCGRSEYASSLDVPKLADKYFQAALQPTKHTSTVRCGIYHLLGVLCEQFPEHLTSISPRLIDIYVSNLKAEMVTKKSKKPELPIIAGCLRGLTAYLNSFSQSVSEGSSYARDIYKFAKMAVNSEVTLTRYDVPKAGLSLISRHAAQFREYLTKDSEYMYSCLYSWCNHKNRDCKLLGLKAMEAFFQEVSNGISEPGGDRDGKIRNYREFMKRFRSLIDNPDTSHKELAVAIKGYGCFAKPCKIYGSLEDIHFMFSEMVQRSEQLFLAGLDSSDIEEVLFHLPTFIEALASISREIEELPDSYLLSLEKLSVLLFQYYPHIPNHIKSKGAAALFKLIMAVAAIPSAFQQYLSHVVFQGLVRSCSLPVVIEAGEESAVVSIAPTEGSSKVFSYLDYKQLWMQLMDAKSLKGLALDYESHELRQRIHRLLYNEYMQAVLSIIRKLDFSSAPTSNAVTQEEDGSATATGTVEGGGKESTTSDPVVGQLPAVPKDFQIFINLVELTRKLIPFLAPSLFTPWILTFSQEVTTLSNQYPLVSGFYKLLATCLTMCNKTHYFKGMDSHNTGEEGSVAMETNETSDIQNCFLLFRSFVREVVVRMLQYKDDLLASCLHLVLVLPREMVAAEIDQLIPAVKQALKLGMGYMPLAKAVLNALENWTQYLSSSQLEHLVTEILPLLNDYLKSSSKTGSEGYTEMPVAISKSVSTNGKKFPVKVLEQWKEGIKGSKDDVVFIRRRIFFLLGSLGGVVNSSFLTMPTEQSLISWDSQNKLEFAIPFSDMKPEIYLDPYLPTVCDLALFSSDRQTKVAACEFLHAIMLFVIGKGAQQTVQKKSPMTKLYQRLIPVALQLACDVERVAEQLFRPLMFQMIHWFTKNTQYESPDTIALLDSILDGIEHSTNTTLRDFSAQCIREFLVWSIKQTSRKQQERSPMNTKSLLKRLYSMAGHPNASKRLGAALAFNNIYTVFREEDSLVDIFIVEMLVVMVNSLKLAHKDNSSLGTVDQCSMALDHIARIIKVKSSTFLSKPNKNRRVPRGLKSAELSVLIPWLLTQTGSLETKARRKCRDLFVELAPPCSRVINVRMWIRNTVESEGGHYFISRFESFGHHGIRKCPTLTKSISFTGVVIWYESFQAALDNYNWILKDQYVSPSEIFTATVSTEKPSQLFTSIEFFLKHLALLEIKGATLSSAGFSSVTVTTSQEREQYDSLRCGSVQLLLELADILLTKHTAESISHTSHVPDWFWGEELFAVLLAAILRPFSLGVQSSDYATTATLANTGLRLLKNMCSCFPSDLRENLVLFLSTNIDSAQPDNLFNQLPPQLNDESVSSQDLLLINRIVQGHIYLAQSGCLGDVLRKQACDITRLTDMLFSSVLSITGKPQIDVGSVLSPLHKHTGELLLRLALELTDNVEPLLHLILSSSKAGTNQGLLLYLTYPDVINAKLLTNLETALAILLKNSGTNSQQVSTVLNVLLDFIQRDKVLKRTQSHAVCSKLILHWSSSLNTWWREKSTADLKLAAVTLLQKIFLIQPKLLSTVTDEQEKLQPVIDMYCQLLGDGQLPLNFKSKTLELLPSFLALPADYHTQLKDSLNRLVSLQFPLNSSDVPAGGPLFNDYINAIDKLLVSLVTSGNLLLLELIINVLCRERKHVHEEKIQTSLCRFIGRMSSPDAVNALGHVYSMFTNDKEFPVLAQRGIAERVCLPMLRECEQSSLLEFFVGHICEIMKTLECKMPRTSDPALENQLVYKLCCFQFMEVLFSRLPASSLSSMESRVNTAYCHGNPTSGKELTQAITKCGHAAKSEDLHGDRVLYDLRRQYHCYAYNALIAVISCTQSKQQFYVGFLFKEDLSKGQFLWDNLIDSDKQYQFYVELETPLKRKKQLVAIRDELNQSSQETRSPSSSPLFPARYISSQYLADSSLSTDVSQYDFTSPSSPSFGGGATVSGATVTADKNQEPASSYIVSEEQLEEDELNCHECILPLMKLLDHMEHNKITPPVTEGNSNPDMPSWMVALHKKMSEGVTNNNLRLFIARLITNRPKVFQPYAKHWLPVLTQLILSGNLGGRGENELDYFTVDVIATMLSWANVAVLEDRHLASKLLQYTMNCANHENRSVLRNNLEIIRTLVECWKDFIQVPTKILFTHFSNPDPVLKSNRCGIQLLGIMVANQLPPFDSATAGSLQEEFYYKKYVANVSFKYKEVYGAAAEVLGMVLARMSEANNPFLDRLEEITTEQLLLMAQPSERSEDKFIVCLHKIQLNYTKLTQRFVEKLLFLLPVLQGPFRSLCLEILQSQADLQVHFYQKLKDRGFHTMLSHRDESIQLACLKIIQGMLVQLSNDDIAQILPLLTKSFHNHSSTQCRVIMYNILMTIYNRLCDPSALLEPDEPTQQIISAVRNQLLLGLGDDHSEIKLKMYEFWNQESNLSSSTLGRLTQLLVTLYSNSTEHQFLYHATNLLLELTSRSPDFNRSLFDTPLSECKFEDYQSIDLSWTQRHLQMTPLFAATQLSQSQTDAGSLGTGMIRSTQQQQSLAFTPTQGPDNTYNWMTPSAQSATPSFTMGATSSTDSTSLLFTRPTMRPPLKNPLRVAAERLGREEVRGRDGSQEEHRQQVMKLKKRFLKSKEMTSSFFAKSEYRKKVMREEVRKHHKAARQSYVVMYRQYRAGELPDIQIKHSELIRPLQAIAQNDSRLARLLFSSLFNSIFAQVDHQLTEEKADSTKRVLKDNINTIMDCSTQYYPPFIGSLQDICYKESQLKLEPPIITTADLVSRQEPIGIMLLEKQLMVNVELAVAAKSSKRPRNKAVSESTETWVELARLYKSLDDYDVLHGIFSNLEGTKDITRKALEAEERGDYLTALNLYKKAIETDWSQEESPTQVEEDLWEDSLLNAYSHLTKWKDLDKAATTNIGDQVPQKLEQLWEDSYYQEHYLPFVLSSKLKLWCNDGSDHGLISFLSTSLQQDISRAILESRYPEQLTLSYVLRDDFDRALYYLNLSLQAVQQNWSSQGDVHISAANTVQCLQRLTEMSEFIEFVKSSENFSSRIPLESLLGKWRKRYPEPKLDPVPVWDNIVSARYMMLKKLSAKFQESVFNQSDSMLADDDTGDSAVSLDLLINSEYIEMYMKMADAARVQSNYPVAEKYLLMVEKILKEDFSEDQSLQLRWLHSVVLMKLQQMEQDRSPSRMETIISLASRLDKFKSVSLLTSNKSFASKHHTLQGKLLALMADMFATDEDGPVALSTLLPAGMNQLSSLTGGSTVETASKAAEKLWIQSLASFNTAVKEGASFNTITNKHEPTVESLEELFSFCDRVIRREEELGDEQLTGLDTKSFPRVIVNHTLTAMARGSNKAREFFPRLLQLVELYPGTMDLMIQKSSAVPCWMFIGWINQMVALLDKTEARAVRDILLAIAGNYPQALYYAFNISSSGYKFKSTSEGIENRQLFELLKDKLRNQLMDDFVTALEQLNSPELVWKDWLENEIKPLIESVNIANRNEDAIKKAWQLMYCQLLETRSAADTSLYGSPSFQKGLRLKKFAQEYAKKVEEKFGKDGNKIVKMTPTQYNSAVKGMYEIMKKDLTGSGLLKDYSPWLDSFQQDDYSHRIEIPGQYDGKSKPLPEYHTKIARFDGKILIMSSIRKPKRITIIGDDTKEYMFLVKGGEDLRLDQRVEQLFDVMNDILSEDPICSQRQLHLRTYSVIPMTPRVGIIEWMKKTTPLKDFIDPEKKQLSTALNMHQKWLKDKYGAGKSAYVFWYYEMYKKAKPDEVEKEYRKFIAAVPWDLLRRSFMNLAATPESFVLLRSHFVKTLATISVCQYILGIGDRHLSNFMIDLETGGLVGIDFGHAFHSATQLLPLPELMPFRLTPQFTNLILPHKVSGQLRSCMIHTLRALRYSPTSLLNTMDVFIKEPSLEWESNAKKQAQSQRIDTEAEGNKWYPKEKVSICRKKLHGYNSAHLMLIELQHGFKSKPEFKYLKGVLLGNPSVNLRSRIGKQCDTVEDQVDCLIDHATDPNILGRVYGGWEAWV